MRKMKGKKKKSNFKPKNIAKLSLGVLTAKIIYTTSTILGVNIESLNLGSSPQKGIKIYLFYMVVSIYYHTSTLFFVQIISKLECYSILETGLIPAMRVVALGFFVLVPL